MNKNNKSEKVDWDRALRRLAHEHAHVRAWPRSYTEDYALATQKLRTLRGEAPRLSAIRINVELTGIADNLPEGCAFAPRCDKAQENCRAGDIVLQGAASRAVRCLYPEDAV